MVGGECARCVIFAVGASWSKRRCMKYVLFLVIGGLLAGRACGQAAEQAGAQTGWQAKGAVYQPEETRLKVLLTKSGLTATYLNQPVALGSVQSLDSLVKKIPDPQHLKIEFESQNADPEESREVIRTLKKCNCHVLTKSLNMKE